MTRRGSALLVTLAATAVLLPLGAWVTLRARLDAALSGHLFRDLHATTIAESGLEHALAAVRYEPERFHAEATPRFSGELGAGRIVFPEPPFGYEVTIVRLNDSTLRLRSRGHGRGTVVREVEAILHWTGERFVVRRREVL